MVSQHLSLAKQELRSNLSINASFTDFSDRYTSYNFMRVNLMHVHEPRVFVELNKRCIWNQNYLFDSDTH